jgi:hypothetical protein
MLDQATANFTASNAAHAGEIGCIGNQHRARAHMSKSNIVAILTVARAERDRHAVLPSVFRLRRRRSVARTLHLRPMLDQE